MTDAFRQLCAEVHSATQTISSLEQCRPHYQRVLDYILTHPEERDEIATALSRLVRLGWQPDGLRSQIYLVQFLMETLKWLEVKIAAKDALIQGGPAWLEYKHLLDIYDPVT
jgi:hypothetical protein